MTGGFEPGYRLPGESREPAFWFLVRRWHVLAKVKGDLATIPFVASPVDLGLKPLRQQYLGALSGTHCFSAEIDEETSLPDGWTGLGLRQLSALLPDELYRVAGRAVQIVEWDRTSQYCGRCGTATVGEQNERAKKCPQCGLVIYPRISPAIIVLVQRDEKLLLAHAHRHPPGFYSVLAGFVEPGETLEEAVEREVKEETGIEVDRIRYFASQPWPFPDSLMIAFTCRHAAGEIKLGEDEIADAQWFTADALPLIPGSWSVARKLIDWFVTLQQS